jgi:hypothetical protein
MAKQLEIRGTERKVLKDVEEAAEAFALATEKAASAAKAKKAKADALAQVMKQHKIRQYASRGLKYEVTLEDVERVKLRLEGISADVSELDS